MRLDVWVEEKMLTRLLQRPCMLLDFSLGRGGTNAFQQLVDQRRIRSDALAFTGISTPEAIAFQGSLKEERREMISERNVAVQFHRGLFQCRHSGLLQRPHAHRMNL